jgi:predicted transcriptional regulator
MITDDEFASRLIEFGVSEKEARTYLHLLSYGPKTPSPIAKSLKTYREDVHRTLTSLVEKGMVRPSLGHRTIYTAVDLDVALDTAVRKQQRELREMKARKRELKQLSKRQLFRPAADVTTFTIIKSVRDLIGTAVPLIISAKKELLWISNRQGVEFGEMFGVIDAEQAFIEGGGHCRCIVDVTYELKDIIGRHLDIGADVRHFGGYHGAYYGVFDKMHCISAINIDIKHLKLDEPLFVLYTCDPVYAGYLVSTFEMLWNQSVPAEERIKELLV